MKVVVIWSVNKILYHMKTTFLLLRIQTSKRIVAIFLLFVVLSMWAAADAYAQNKIKYTMTAPVIGWLVKRRLWFRQGVLSDDEGEFPYMKKNFRKLRWQFIPTYPWYAQVDISGVEKFENARISLYDLTGTLMQQWGSISQSNAVDIWSNSGCISCR